MRIGIFGSTGFIGSNLAIFLERNNQVISFTRDDLSLGAEKLAEKISELDVIINLVGSPILTKRWTRSYKRIIISSRLTTINKIKEALMLVDHPPPVFICASAVGIYKANVYNDEFENTYENDFLSDVVKLWEAASSDLGALVSKYIIIRLGIVLSHEGGALKQLVKVFKLGFGGVIGRKNSYYPYISLNDVLRGIQFLIQNQDSNGVYNFVEPERITNWQFTQALAESLGMKARINIPALLIKLIIGERAGVILAGQNVFPKKLLNLGFEFEDADIAGFLNKELN
jgi:uncharacterized protein (TIGR01777 family)